MIIDYKKTILRTGLFTLLCLFLLSVIVWLVMFFVFPKTLGDFCYNLGIENMSANLYYKDYVKSGDITSIYKSLNIEIKNQDNNKIIKYYEVFTQDDEYLEFMNQYKSRNEELNIGVLEKSSILNEQNYLTNQYISALIATNQDNQAFNLALSLFKDYNNFTLTDQGVYAFNQFLSTQNFDRMPDGYSKTIIQSMQEYFDNSIEMFNENIDTNDNLTKAYLISLGNRIIVVGHNINSIYANNNDVQKETNSNKMIDINEKIKGLL